MALANQSTSYTCVLYFATNDTIRLPLSATGVAAGAGTGTANCDDDDDVAAKDKEAIGLHCVAPKQLKIKLTNTVSCSKCTV